MYFPFISRICHDYIDSFSETDVICYLGTRYQLPFTWTRSNTTWERGTKRIKNPSFKSEIFTSRKRPRDLFFSGLPMPNVSSHWCKNSFTKLTSISRSFHTQLRFVKNGPKPWCQFKEQAAEGTSRAGKAGSPDHSGWRGKAKGKTTMNSNRITVF